MPHRPVNAIVSLCILLIAAAAAASAAQTQPLTLTSGQAGAVVESVTIDTHGVTSPRIVSCYLTMRQGDVLTQRGIDRDYGNLIELGGYRVSLSVESGERSNTVRLHWDVAAKPLAFSAPSYYNDKPLEAPFPGAGFVAKTPPIDRRGMHFALSAHFGPYANAFGALYSVPLHIDAGSAVQRDLLVGFGAGRGVYRQPYPPNEDVNSWFDRYRIAYWAHNANDTQFEAGIEHLKTSTSMPTGIVSPYVYPAWRAPSRNTLIEAGLLHGCVHGIRLYPPYCSFQYRLQVADAINAFGSTPRYQSFMGGAAGYARIGDSVLAAQALVMRTGGVLPDSLLVCSAARAYPKAFCGTDAQLMQLEYRIAGTRAPKLQFTIFFDDAASRVRGEIAPVATSRFLWHGDAGAAVTYRNAITVNVAYGGAGGRITVALTGQSF